MIRSAVLSRASASGQDQMFFSVEFESVYRSFQLFICTSQEFGTHLLDLHHSVVL